MIDYNDKAMENIITRFQHIAEKIFDQLDNRSLVNCREVTSSWQKFIDCKNLPWIQIVNIPKILKKKDTYWHVASKTGQIIILDMIFEIEQNFDINTQDEQGRTVFHCACMNGHTKIAQRLIQNSVLVNLDLNLKSWNGWTALHLSCASGQSKIVNILIKNSEQFNIELNAKNHYEMTGFHLACDYGHLDIVDLLMKKSTELNIELNAKDHCDGTGFHLACGRGWLRIVQKLLEKSEEVSIDLNDKDINGWTGFHMACAGGRVDIVDMIIENAFKVRLCDKNETCCRGSRVPSNVNSKQS